MVTGAKCPIFHLSACHNAALLLSFTIFAEEGILIQTFFNM
jgi:hypothetical protein